MRQTKKITLSAACIALGVLFMALGAFVEVLDLTVAALCSCLMAFVFIEIGDKYAFGVWIGTSILGAIFFTHSLVWVTYFLICGIYPILKAYIERQRRVIWIPLKLVYFVIASTALILVSELLLGIPFFEDDFAVPFFEDNMMIFRALLYVLLIVATFVYDVFMTVMIRAYFARFRKYIKQILK